jgi:hypothetical protein
MRVVEPRLSHKPSDIFPVAMPHRGIPEPGRTRFVIMPLKRQFVLRS